MNRPSNGRGAMHRSAVPLTAALCITSRWSTGWMVGVANCVCRARVGRRVLCAQRVRRVSVIRASMKKEYTTFTRVPSPFTNRYRLYVGASVSARCPRGMLAGVLAARAIARACIACGQRAASPGQPLWLHEGTFGYSENFQQQHWRSSEECFS